MDNKRNQRCVRFIWRSQSIFFTKMDNRLLPDYEQHLPLFSGIVQDRLNRFVIANKWVGRELRILRMN